MTEDCDFHAALCEGPMGYSEQIRPALLPPKPELAGTTVAQLLAISWPGTRPRFARPRSA
ncbi:hypothetical protein AB7M17_006695 [Bradyrhizobium sp. USDA 377]